MTRLVEVRRYIIRRVNGRDVRVEITHCFWCSNTEHVCPACAARANATKVLQ